MKTRIHTFSSRARLYVCVRRLSAIPIHAYDLRYDLRAVCCCLLPPTYIYIYTRIYRARGVVGVDRRESISSTNEDVGQEVAGFSPREDIFPSRHLPFIFAIARPRENRRRRLSRESGTIFAKNLKLNYKLKADGDYPSSLLVSHSLSPFLSSLSRACFPAFFMPGPEFFPKCSPRLPRYTFLEVDYRQDLNLSCGNEVHPAFEPSVRSRFRDSVAAIDLRAGMHAHSYRASRASAKMRHKRELCLVQARERKFIKKTIVQRHKITLVTFLSHPRGITCANVNYLFE